MAINMSDIHFGTDGWRGIIADNFTFRNVKIAAQAIADYISSNYKQDRRSIVVGYDRRFFSREFAETVSSVMCANNIKTYLTTEYTPTPAVSYAVTKYKTAGGIVITASHNPPLYNGIKFKSEYGGPAMPHVTKQIEAYLNKNNVREIPLAEAKDKKKLVMVDVKNIYLSRLKQYLDLKSLKTAKFSIVVDTMYGAATGYFNEVLKNSKCNVFYMNENHDPLFGNLRPEPIKANLFDLIKEVKKKKADVGLVTDGDGDRVGMVDDKGEFVDAQHIISLLLYHLVKNRKLTGGVVKTNATTVCVKKIASYYNLPVFETPIGFKYASELMMKEDILIGGEESGGIGFKGYIPERDGILACLLLLEMMTIENKNIGQLITDMERKFGVYRYMRTDLNIGQDIQKKIIDKLKRSDVSHIANVPVISKTTFDGVKFILKNESWLLVRSSGTEPIMRIYAEGNSEKLTSLMLKYGVGLINKFK